MSTLYARAWQDVFRYFGHEHDLKSLHDQIGKGGDQLLPVFLSPEEIDDFGERLEEHRGKVLKSKYLDQIVAFPIIRDLFERLLKDGDKIALASSAKGAELSHYNKLADIDDLLDVETSSDDAEKSKLIRTSSRLRSVSSGAWRRSTRW